ncbi:uncharacterized protein LOC124885815 [Capsicum annuum]|uniref:uncharacterized protein LOC124885815 n=1 Tax=Capsicum annuum TaxID=4072 RepID=UPI001FB0772B|nr:uncharacterized protein LOC124885815 [Capsicum annuum]
MDIWVQSVDGKKKERVKGLSSLGQSVKATNSSTSTLPKEINEMIKSQIDASNAALYAQLQNERKKNKRMRKELHLLMKHVYNKSSSNDERPSQEDYPAYEDESDDDSDDVNVSDNPDNVNESDSDPDGWKMTTDSHVNDAEMSVVATNVATTSRTTALQAMVPVEKLKKITGVDFKRWNQKMFLYLITLCLQRFTSEKATDFPEGTSDQE